jgi:hypothetical protein
MSQSRRFWNEDFIVVYDESKVKVDGFAMSSWHLDQRARDLGIGPALQLYDLRFKLILPHIIAGPVLLCDDDVLLQRDPSYLGDTWATHSIANSMNWSDKNITLTNFLSESCGVYWDPDVHKAWACDAGIVRYNEATKAQLLKNTIAVFNHPDFSKIFLSLSRSQRRVFDQQIIGITAMQMSMPRLTTRADYFPVLYKYPSPYCTKRPKSTWIHYCASSHKQAWLEFFLCGSN